MEHPVITTSPAEELKVRDRLLEAAIRLFAQKGYAATSVSEIVEAAGVTKPILYYYFKNKEGLYLEILHAALAPYTAILEAAAQAQGPATARILALSHELYDIFVKNLEVARIIMAVYYSPPQGAPAYDFDAHRLHHVRVVRQIIDEGIAAGEFKPLDSETVALGIIGLNWLVFDLELTGKGLENSMGRAGHDRILNIFLSGAAAGKGSL